MSKKIVYEVPDYAAIVKGWMTDRGMSMNKMEVMSRGLDIEFSRQWLARVLSRACDPQIGKIGHILRVMRHYDEMMTALSRRQKAGQV